MTTRFKADEKHISKINRENMKSMEAEAYEAKKLGLSYGKYKAQLKKDDTESEYPVSTMQHITRTASSPTGTRATARIRSVPAPVSEGVI